MTEPGVPKLSFDPDEVIGEPADEAAARFVAGLQTSGLVEVDPEQRVRYKPASEVLAAHVATLDRLYRERPVTLIRVIYGLRDSKIRSFADAFRLRRK